jgi:hypothetical protein
MGGRIDMVSLSKVKSLLLPQRQWQDYFMAK